VETDHQDLERTLLGEFGRALAEEFYELVMNYLHDLLAGRDGLEDVLARALGLHPVNELAGDLEMDVGGQQGGAHFLEGIRHVGLGQGTDPTQVAQGAGQFIGQAFEHGTRN